MKPLYGFRFSRPLTCIPAVGAVLWWHRCRSSEDSVDGFAVIAIALQPALGLLGAVVPGTTHGPVLIHQPEQVGANAPEQGSLFHAFKLATAPQACNRTRRNECGKTQPGWVRPNAVLLTTGTVP